MRSVHDHYDKHLGPIYSWMAGGFDAALERGRMELAALALDPTRNSSAVDLGAGFGMHSIPLAQRGFAVVAVDSSAQLLRELSSNAAGLRIRTVEAELLSFRSHLSGRVGLALCMGDTLPHLQSEADVDTLFAEVSSALTGDGVFVLTFRDYTTALVAESRFIPVRSDNDRVHTCFLEYEATHVTVHDLLHERDGSQWKLRVSSYRKLRLASEWTCRALQRHGFSVTQEPGLSGMVRLTARPA